MATVKRSVPAKRLVWRITAEAPLGEYVEIGGGPAVTSASSSSPSKPIEMHEGGWVESSFDLARGLEVRELIIPADHALKRPRGSGL
jgi:hypothetical protein